MPSLTANIHKRKKLHQRPATSKTPRTTRASRTEGGSSSPETPLESHIDLPQMEMESIPPRKRRGGPARAKPATDQHGNQGHDSTKARPIRSSGQRSTDTTKAADVAQALEDGDSLVSKDVGGNEVAQASERVEVSDSPEIRIPAASLTNKISYMGNSSFEGGDLYGTDSDSHPGSPPSTGSKIVPAKKVVKWKGKGKGKVADEEFHNIDGSSDSEQEINQPSASHLPVPSNSLNRSKGKGIDLPRDEDMLDIDQAADDDSDSELPEWTDDDQILLDATYPQELALWWRCKEIFDCAPQDLFPRGVKASNGHWEGYHCKDQDRYIKNDMCLTGSFCATLSELVCYPYFRKNKEYVKYALSNAIKARCGDKAPVGMADGYDSSVDWDKKFKEIIKDLQDSEIFFDNKQTEIVKHVLSTHMIGDLPPHSGFLDMSRLKKIAKSSRAVKETYDSNNLMNIDLQNIIKAWDSYNKEGGLNLPSIKASRDVYDKQHGHAKHGTRAKILGWKKAWILQKRQEDREEAARSKSRNFSSSPLLGDSAASDDPFTDSAGEDQSFTQIRSPITQDPSNSKGNSISNVNPRDYEDYGGMMGGDGMPSDDDFEFRPYGPPASTLTDSQEEFVVDDIHKADVQDAHGSTQKIISPNFLDQTQDISVRDDAERTSILFVQAYDMFSDNDDEVPRYQENAGLQLVDTVNAVINNVEELWDDYERGLGD